jgi:hypothetical protein
VERSEAADPRRGGHHGHHGRDAGDPCP